MRDYKVGDTVIIIKNTRNHNLPVGTVGKIVHITPLVALDIEIFTIKPLDVDGLYDTYMFDTEIKHCTNKHINKRRNKNA